MGDPELHVSGGAGGTTARYDDLAMLGRHSDDLAVGLASISAECHGALADPDVLASAVLDPKGVARFEGALLGALDGRTGLTALGFSFAERAVALRAVAASYQAVDAAQARLIDGLRWSEGYLASNALMALAFTPLGPLVALGGYGAYQLSGGRLDWQRLLTDHPGIVDNLAGMGPGLITGLTGLPVGDVRGAAHLIGLLYPDGTAHVEGPASDPSSRVANPPNGFGDLIDALDYRNGTVNQNTPDQIDIRVITHPDGTRAYIVDIPGTKVWDAPGTQTSHLNDLGTNVHVMGGDVTAREHAIAEALHRAGADPGDPVMLVGHSQGGMVAAQAAHDSASGSFPYNVTHVVTAGAPIGRIDVPGNVQVLSLENSHDITPHLDAADNPDRPNRTTVTFDSQLGSIGQNHGTASAYLPAAQALDHSTDPSVTAYRASAGAFLGTPGDGTTVVNQAYALTRTP